MGLPYDSRPNLSGRGKIIRPAQKESQMGRRWNTRIYNWVLFLLIIAMCCQLFDAQWDGVGTDLKRLRRNKESSYSSVGSASTIMSSIVDGSKNSENNDERKGSSNERFMEVNKGQRKFAPLGVNMVVNFVKKLLGKKTARKKGASTGKDYCGCDEMAGNDCKEAVRACCNSFCEPLCVEDMI